MEFDAERVPDSNNVGVVVGHDLPDPLTEVDTVAARIRQRMTNTIENIIANRGDRKDD